MIKKNDTEENEVSLADIPRLATWKQYFILSFILALMIYFFIILIGHGEHDKQFCEEKLGDSLLENERAGLLQDMKKKTYPPSDEKIWACCRFPKNVERISVKKYCIYTPDYEEPNIKDKFNYFLKRFK